MVDALRLATYSAAMPLPRGFVPPCLPTKAPQPPSGDTWVHEIKHDGFRVIARKDGERVRLFDEGEAGQGLPEPARTELGFRLLIQHGSTEGAALPAVRLRLGAGDSRQCLRRPPHHVHLQESAV